MIHYHCLVISDNTCWTVELPLQPVKHNKMIDFPISIICIYFIQYYSWRHFAHTGMRIDTGMKERPVLDRSRRVICPNFFFFQKFFFSRVLKTKNTSTFYTNLYIRTFIFWKKKIFLHQKFSPYYITRL